MRRSTGPARNSHGPRPRAGVAAGAALLLLGAAERQEAAGAQPRPPNLVLVTLDTTRADRLGCYGGDASVSPTIDALAGKGVLFEDAHTQVPLTLPAHASLLTALPPQSHGLRINGTARLPEAAVTIQEVLAEQGYATAAFPAAEVLDRKYGLDQGFAVFEDGMPTGEDAIPMRPAAATTELVLQWMEDGLREPFFLWLHYFDAHAPYRVPDDLKGRFPSDYEAEIHEIDRNLGRTLQALEERGLLPRTWICITADHGEGLGEHQESSHGVFLYETTMRVPLLFSHESLTPARVPFPVSHLDVAPTLLDLAGQPPLPGGGRSLEEVLRGSGTLPEEQPLYLESYFGFLTYGWSPLQGVLSGEWKFIEAPRPELYDLTRDPGELTNLAGEERERVTGMRRLLERERQSRLELAAELVVLDSESERRLAELGYLVAGPGTEAALPAPSYESGPDPKDQTGVLPLVYSLFDASKKNDGARILQLCDQILKVDPGNIMALQYRGTQLVRLQRYPEAITPLLEVDRRGRSTPSSLLALGVALMNVDQLDEAAAILERSIARSPDEAKAVHYLGEVEERRGNRERALQLYRRVLEDPAVPAAAKAVIEARIQRLEGSQDP